MLYVIKYTINFKKIAKKVSDGICLTFNSILTGLFGLWSTKALTARDTLCVCS